MGEVVGHNCVMKFSTLRALCTVTFVALSLSGCAVIDTGASVVRAGAAVVSTTVGVAGTVAGVAVATAGVAAATAGVAVTAAGAAKTVAVTTANVAVATTTTVIAAGTLVVAAASTAAYARRADDIAMASVIATAPDRFSSPDGRLWVTRNCGSVVSGQPALWVARRSGEHEIRVNEGMTCAVVSAQ